MKSLLQLNKYLYKYRFRLLWGTFFITVSNIFAIYPAEILRQGIDLVQDGTAVYQLFDGSPIALNLSGNFYTILLYFGLIVIASALLKGIFMFFMRQTIIVMSRLIEYDLKNDMFDHYQQLDLAFFKRNRTGDLMARISEDVSQVRMYLGPAIMYAISTVSLFVLVLARMVSINAELTLYVMAPLPLLAFLVYKVNSLVIHRSEAVQSQLSRMTSFVQEFFSGIRVIKSYNREKTMYKQFDIIADKYKQLNLSLVRINALFFPVISLMIGFSTLITVYIGGNKVYSGDITTGTIAEFILYVGMLTWPVASMGWVTSIVQRAAASHTRINEFLKTKPEIISPQASAMPFDIKGGLAFENVSFRYPDSGVLALDNLSLKIDAGTSLAIIGRTGSGKSTIAAMIARLYDPDDGRVLMDGIPLTKIPLNELRGAIAYVPQEVFLFSDTIFNNIAFGLKNHDDANLNEKVEQAAKDAAVYENIVNLKDGFQTRVGERGVTLSGGQKQRISMARAIIRKPALLIFDDCMSAVDTETEEKILNKLKELMKGRTTVIISHRISSIKHCDRIILLDQGKIVEQGSHEDLLHLEGAYAELYSKQILEEQTNPNPTL
ncbi:MAG: ABC transporter ATP-binding protein [Bacteroidia bacterium]|nr:ABC transporter ATP-binding protein [Bacteroidia bacterium]